MEINSKKYFEKFLKDNLTPNNAERIYDMLWRLETGEETLFRNCCKTLGIDRDEFLSNFDIAALSTIDDDMGLTWVALGERFGTIEYDDPDKPCYGTISDIVFDDNNSEYVSVHQEIYQATVREMVKNYDETEYSSDDIIGIIQDIGVFNHAEKLDIPFHE